MEHRQVRRQLVALGREMPRPLGVEPALVAARKQRGDDDGRERGRRVAGQIST
jgi:hypothetical protein